MLRSDVRDHSDVHIAAKAKITEKVEDLDLLEYSDNYSTTSESLWKLLNR